MATIDSGSGGSGRKTINHELPLIPFIDLLLCTVMFLLVTAVWATLGVVPAQQNTVDGMGVDRAAARLHLDVVLTEAGYTLRSDVGTQIDIPRADGEYDQTALRTQLARHRLDVGRVTLVYLQPDDGIGMQDVVAAMDTLRAEGFEAIAFPGAS